MGEGREESIPTREETSFKIGERHAKRVIATVKNYVAQCRSLEEKGDRLPSALRSLQRQKEATLSVLRRELNVEEGWLTHDGKTPSWLKLLQKSEQLIEEIRGKYGGRSALISSPGRLQTARRRFLEKAVFWLPPDGGLNDRLLSDLQEKLNEAQKKTQKKKLMGELANVLLSRLKF